MGIHGLSTFVRKHSSLKTQKTWTFNDPAGDLFVIDGNAFVFHHALANQDDWAYGGQYSCVVQAVENAVRLMQKAGITPMFLFDGALPPSKLTTRIKRYQSYIERAVTVEASLSQMNESNDSRHESGIHTDHWSYLYLIPPLTVEICVIALCNMGLEVILCENEADEEVVRQAKEHGGYVVSKDSDMHIYPEIGKGYIPLDSLQILPNGISATVYCPQLLTSFLKLRASLLPLFGTLLGNDYLNINVTKPPITKWCTLAGYSNKNQGSRNWPLQVAEFIRESTRNIDDENVIDKVAQELNPILLTLGGRELEEYQLGDTLENCIMESIRQYDPKSKLIFNQQKPLILKPELPLSDGIQQRLEKGCLGRQFKDVIRTGTFWTNIFVEYPDRESSWTISRPLRRCLYRMILMLANSQSDEHGFFGVVIEYVRHRQRLAIKSADCTTMTEIASLVGRTVSMQQLSDDMSVQDEVFLRLHNSEAIQLDTLPRLIQPLVLCLRYFIHHSAKEREKLANHEVMALITASIRSLANCLGFVIPLKETGRPNLKKRSIHITAQWQGIIYSSYLLSQILGIRQVETRNALSNVYDGLLVHSHLLRAKQGASIGKLLEGAGDDAKTLFCNVYHTVTSGFENMMHIVYDYNVPLAVEQTEKDWFTPYTLKKKANVTNTKSDQEDRLGKNKKRNTATSTPRRKGNAFEVLSFGCSFDE